jgi:EAL domain-containing protein (putative c-di-GMP-specific phosphodiesterase class I)
MRSYRYLDNDDVTKTEKLFDTLGQVSPEKFISLAEETGMIVELGYFVFRSACEAYTK